MVDRVGARLSSNIKQDAYTTCQLVTKGGLPAYLGRRQAPKALISATARMAFSGYSLEEPPMTVDLYPSQLYVSVGKYHLPSFGCVPDLSDCEIHTAIVGGTHLHTEDYLNRHVSSVSRLNLAVTGNSHFKSV